MYLHYSTGHQPVIQYFDLELAPFELYYYESFYLFSINYNIFDIYYYIILYYNNNIIIIILYSDTYKLSSVS